MIWTDHEIELLLALLRLNQILTVQYSTIHSMLHSCSKLQTQRLLNMHPWIEGLTELNGCDVLL